LLSGSRGDLSRSGCLSGASHLSCLGSAQGGCLFGGLSLRDERDEVALDLAESCFQLSLRCERGVEIAIGLGCQLLLQ
jgi:hypothetical protein